MTRMKLFSTAAALIAGAGIMMAAESNEPCFHLSFDEGKEGAEVCVDRMKPDRICKLNNPKRITFADGKIGKALVLDNPPEKTAPNENPMAGVDVLDFWEDDFTKAMSIEVWVKIAKDADYRRSFMRILQCGGQYGLGFSLYYNWANFQFLTGPTNSSKDALVVSAPVPDLRDQWVHIAVTYDGTKKVVLLYVNGECVKEMEDFVITPPRNRKQPLFIGRMGNSRGWRGAIDEVKIYKRVLPPAEILGHAKLEL